MIFPADVPRTAPATTDWVEEGGARVNKVGLHLGTAVVIEPFCIVGEVPRGQPAYEPLHIGARTLLRSGTVVYKGVSIGEDCETGHGVLIREGNQIGSKCRIGTHSVLEGHCDLGANVRIHSNCFLESVTIGDECFVGPSVVFTDDPHPPCPRYRECDQGVVVGAGARIGAGAVITPGVTIGPGALIGAGAVVTRDVPGGVVVVGNPGRIQASVDELRCFSHLMDRPYGHPIPNQ